MKVTLKSGEIRKIDQNTVMAYVDQNTVMAMTDGHVVAKSSHVIWRSIGHSILLIASVTMRET